MLDQPEGDPISPLVRGVAALFGGGLVIAALFMWASVLLPNLGTRHPTSAWGVFVALGGGIGCFDIARIDIARIFIRAARTGISPPRSRRFLKP